MGTSAVGIASCISTSNARAQAPTSVHRFKVGEAEVSVISDGEMSLPLRLMLPDRDGDAVAKLLGSPTPQLAAQVNVAVVRIGDQTLLVDTGGGPDFMPTLGKLAERLAAAGLDPDGITKVIFTHAHADHLWGVIDPLGGDTLFEKAEHLMSQVELDYWLKPDVAERTPEALRGMAMGTQRRLKSIAARVKTVRAGVEVMPGVQLLETAGHTPGHTSVLIQSGNQKLMIGGDALTHPIVSFAEPGWRWGPDIDGDRAVATRRRLLDQLATDRIELLGYHFPWPGRGRVERSGSVYRFIPTAGT